MNPAEDFLDLACLTYEGNDDQTRRQRAATRIASNPALCGASIWCAAATADVDAIARELRQDAGRARAPGGPRGWQPLHYLCFSRVLASDADPVRAAEVLLAAGADPAASFSIGACTLRAVTGAIGGGEGGPQRQPPHPSGLALARQLLAAGAPANDPQGAYNRSHSPGDDWLELLIEHGLAPEDEIDWQMNVAPTPRTLDFLLCSASLAGFVERVELLLGAGADPNAANPYDGRHVLVGARIARRVEIARRLVRAGSVAPGISAADRYRIALAELDRTAVQRAVELEPSVVNDGGALAEAAGLGFDDAVALALELGANVDALDRNGSTSLHRAAIGGHIAVVRVLLAAGADRTAVDRHHSGTPLDWARHGGHGEVVELLSRP